LDDLLHMLGKLFSNLAWWRYGSLRLPPTLPSWSAHPSDTTVFPHSVQAPRLAEKVPPANQADPENGAVLTHREVLDETLGIRGVEFFLREELHDKIDNRRANTRRFLDNLLVDQLNQASRTQIFIRQTWLKLSESSILRLGTNKLPNRASILLDSGDAVNPAGLDTREAIAALQDAGHEVWLDDPVDTPWFSSLADLADGAAVRIARLSPGDAQKALNSVSQHHLRLKLGAWDVNSQDEYEMAHEAGCCRFSGSFVTRRENWDGNKLTPQIQTVAALINQIREDANFRVIAGVLKRDMTTSYRLLRYVNTASQGLAQSISSIEQGLMLLGQQQIDRWLSLLLLSSGPLGDRALTEIALTRARFLELLGAYRLPPLQCDKLFVLGLFSMLDVALKVPLETAIGPLHLGEPLVRALLYRDGPYGPYLALADACQADATADICKYAVMLGLTTTKVNARQLEAINWVAEISANPSPNPRH
jgi:c-di-GMP phosphodiesterase